MNIGNPLRPVNPQFKILFCIFSDSFKGIFKNLPYPLFWRGIKGEVKTKTQVFRDALNNLKK